MMKLTWLKDEVGFLLQGETPDIKCILFETATLASGWELIAVEDLSPIQNTVGQRVFFAKGDLKIQIDLEKHGEYVYLWEIKLLGPSWPRFQEYTVLNVSYKKPLFKEYFAPCFYEPDANLWEGKIPLHITREINGFSISNNYIVLNDEDRALLIGTIGLIPDGTQTITTMGACFKIRHSNTDVKTIPKGILIVDQQKLGAIEKFNALNGNFLKPRKKTYSWWREPQWCTWVPYREDVTEEKVLAEAAAIRKNNFPIRNIVIDAGWYDWTGHWEAHPVKFPSGMKALIEKLHAMDFKVLLWVNPHAVKEESPNFPANGEGLVLDEQGKPYYRYTDWENEGKWYFWDPTHPIGKKMLEKWLVKAICDWQVDGFKVDYIYVGPQGRFRTLIPLEANTYVYEIIKYFYQTAKYLREDLMISGSFYNQVLAMFEDDIRTGDTFGGCNNISLTIAKNKMDIARTQVPDILYINDYIGSYDQPIELEVFLQWMNWLASEPNAVFAFGWQTWRPPLIEIQDEIAKIIKGKAINNS